MSRSYSWLLFYVISITNRMFYVPAFGFGMLGISSSQSASEFSSMTKKRFFTGHHRASACLHCICVNCKWVTSCQAYHFVETKHGQPHMTDNPTFEPRDGSPTIQVHIRTIRTDQDRQDESNRMWKDQQRQKNNILGAATAAAATVVLETRNDTPPGSDPAEWAPVTTCEYDVVACDDFVEETGCWVQNMPDEIKRANPHFVPS